VKIYEWILFDADKTLFHFDDFSGLNCMFKKHFENGEINAQYLQEQRFYFWSENYKYPPRN
jgi:5'-nucleotidase